MIRSILLLALLIFSAPPTYADQSARPAVAAVHQAVAANFTYRMNVREWEDFSFRHSGLEPFVGDCVSYSLAVYYQLSERGANPYFLVLDGRRVKHMVTCAGGWCADNFRQDLIRESALKRRYGRVLLKDRFPVEMFAHLKVGLSEH